MRPEYIKVTTYETDITSRDEEWCARHGDKGNLPREDKTEDHTRKKSRYALHDSEMVSC